MNQDQFERIHGEDWARFEAWLKLQDATRRERQTTTVDLSAAELPHLYRRLCQHLALARERHYGTRLIDRLHRLVLGGHQALYAARADTLDHVLEFAIRGFPRLVRAEARLFWLASALFYLPALALFATIMIWPDMIYTVADPLMVMQFEEMYDPANEVLGRTRDGGTDVMMFGHYIRNNIGIAFQTFAGGILAGLGTLFYLIFNGVYLGAVAGHLTRVGYTETFWTFVAGHSALELTAIVLAGVAGLKLGLALVAPGRLGRREAIRRAAQVAVRIIYGCAAMLLAAAFVEAFWSSTRVFPPAVKYSVGIAFWLLLAAYFLLAGRRHAA